MHIPTVLVTGAAGLIGSCVAKLLVKRGSRVIACDNFSNGAWRSDDPNIVWLETDIAGEGLYDELDRNAPDAVIHCAAHPGGKSLADPVENVRVNCLGSMRVFQWCTDAKKPVVFLSSSAVYGEQPPVPITEEAPLNPGTIYAACKVACENYLRILGEGYGLQWTVLRLFATYGAGHLPSMHQGIVNVMLTQLTAGNKVVVKGSLKRMRDMVFVDDAATAVADTLFAESTRGMILNVGTGRGVAIEDMIYNLAALLGKRREDIEIEEADPTVGDPLYSVADISKLRDLTNFKPAYYIERGLETLVRARTGLLQAK